MSPKPSGKRLNADAVPTRLQPVMRRLVSTYRSRGVRPVDLVLASFPKSGSTWLRFVLASALSGAEVDFDTIASVSPPIGRHRAGPQIVPGGGRLIKSHDLPRFGRSRPRVLCLVRDGRDVAVSEYFHLLRRGRYDGEFERFFPAFLAGQVGSFGTWQAHTRAWLDYRARGGNVLFVKYEDLLADPQQTLAVVDDHFGLGLGADRIATAIAENTKERMRAKEAVSPRVKARSVRPDIPVVREARSGGWRETLSEQQLARFEQLAGSELRDLGYALVAPTPGGG